MRDTALLQRKTAEASSEAPPCKGPAKCRPFALCLSICFAAGLAASGAAIADQIARMATIAPTTTWFHVAYVRLPNPRMKGDKARQPPKTALTHSSHLLKETSAARAAIAMPTPITQAFQVGA